MRKKTLFGYLLLLVVIIGCQNQKRKDEKISNEEFPEAMVNFKPYENNPVFTGTNNNAWDNQIRVKSGNGVSSFWRTVSIKCGIRDTTRVIMIQYI